MPSSVSLAYFSSDSWIDIRSFSASEVDAPKTVAWSSPRVCTSSTTLALFFNLAKASRTAPSARLKLRGFGAVMTFLLPKEDTLNDDEIQM
jgi:hypothetical protein